MLSKTICYMCYGNVNNNNLYNIYICLQRLTYVNHNISTWILITYAYIINIFLNYHCNISIIISITKKTIFIKKKTILQTDM